MERIIVLPDHVMEEILLRLPVKDLLSWKCVSKRWYALICDDEFVKKHYGFQYAMHLAAQGDVPILIKNCDLGEPPQFHLLTKQGSCDVVVNITPEFDRDVVPPTFSCDSQERYRYLRCIGVINGIVGLRWGQDRLALWNPATREFKDVPRLPDMFDNKDTEAFSASIGGLGFDLHSNDFKILGRICTNSRASVNENIYEFHLYSLRSDSWRRIKDTPITYPCLDLPFTDAYFNNGVHYWTSFARDYSRFGIVAFNFSSEIFKEFELPRDKKSWYRCNLRIGKYKEGLALLVGRTLESKETCIEIWAANRYRDNDNEVPSSWELVVKISPIRMAEIWIGTVLDCGDILLFSDSETNNTVKSIVLVDDDLFVEEAKAYVFHPSTGTFNNLGISFGTSYRYVESLFPLSRRLNYS